MPKQNPDTDRISGDATREGTEHYAERFAGRVASGHFRHTPAGISVSSIGIGTYLGDPDAATDRAYTESVVAAVEGGLNLVDSAINYRFQRSERSIGAALKQLLANGFSRDEIILCTKAGFLTPDGEMPADTDEYFAREYLSRHLFRPEDIAQGCHCLAPAFMADQLERSRNNLGVECIDVFYLHNPETQLQEIDRAAFRGRLATVFTFLEAAVADGKIAAYGMATWNAFREEARSPRYLSLEDMVSIARETAGENHHFRFVQLPFNLAMPEALTLPNQIVEGKTMAMVQAARAMGITLVSSAALLQGQLTKELPSYVAEALGLHSNSALALQFARSAPGITTALVGMSRVDHVKANLELVAVERAPRDQFLKLFGPHS
ncbi:MAG TPA: aldo/keto reductase [Candidatus Acidoferrum sp.]|nr:aldo/keto reductase [Candidatus Acidoferrum sp.]